MRKAELGCECWVGKGVRLRGAEGREAEGVEVRGAKSADPNAEGGVERVEELVGSFPFPIVPSLYPPLEARRNV